MIDISLTEAIITFFIATGLSYGFIGNYLKLEGKMNFIYAAILGFLIALILYLINNIYAALKEIYGQVCKLICGCEKNIDPNNGRRGNGSRGNGSRGNGDCGDLGLDGDGSDINMEELQQCLAN